MAKIIEKFSIFILDLGKINNIHLILFKILLKKDFLSNSLFRIMPFPMR